MSYSKSKKSTIISIVAIVLSFAAFLCVFVGSGNKSGNDGISYFDYSIGTIDDDTGKALDSKLSIYTRGKHDVEGLEIKLADEPTVTYKIFFYDEEGEYLSASNELTGDFASSGIPDDAATFRVLITPIAVDGEAVEVTTLNKASYIEQLDISFDK